VRTAVAVAVAVALISAALAAGAWEMRRLDHNVQALRTDVEGAPKSDARPDRELKLLRALTSQTVKLREADLRQEFYAPFYSYETQLRVAVETNYSACGTVRQQWQSYVNKVIESLNDRNNRALRMALRHDDPDYHATLLNAFGC
jgi:hypothetical protein